MKNELKEFALNLYKNNEGFEYAVYEECMTEVDTTRIILDSLGVSYSVYFVYTDLRFSVEERNKAAGKRINRILKEEGFDTNIEEYKYGYLAPVGEDCIEVLVVGDYGLKSYQGQVNMYKDKESCKERLFRPSRKGRD